MTAMDKAELWTVAQITSRDGWTVAAIKRFLGEADETKPNPRYSAGARMRLYRVDRTLAAETTPEFKAWAQRSQARSKRAGEAADRRRQQLFDWVNQLEIALPQMEPDDLVRRALDSYNTRQYRHEVEYEHEAATAHSDPRFLARIAVNFLRHRGSDYDALLDATFGAVGRNEAAARIKQRILGQIAIQYPHLADEAARQHKQLMDNLAYVQR